jgi:hypothetical protein
VLTEAETLYIASLQALPLYFLKKLCHLNLGYGVLVNIAQSCQLDFLHSVRPDGFQPHGVWDMERCEDTQEGQTVDLRQMDEWTGICYGSVHCSSAHARSSNIAAR